MTRIEIKSRIGPNGILEVRVPCGQEEANREVLVTVQPAAGQKNLAEWHTFIAETAGSIQDPSFFRHEQGRLDEPDNWE
jgi:hypothetical protein